VTSIPTRHGRDPSGESARTDAQLLERIALEDLGALGELYDRHHADVRRVLERVTRRSADVDDLVQATFLALQPLAGRFVGDGSARAWLCGIAVRLASRNERGVRRWIRALTSLSWSVVVPPPATPETQASGREELVVLEQALWKMSAKKRAAFVLIEVQGMPVEEVARALQIPVASVRSRLFHAKKQLRKALRGAAW
jgi:RNA polymerase sigma-70 factor (ECF subfamily)